MPGKRSARTRPPADLAARLGISFDDPALLARALVHGSWLHEHPDEAPGENERLEFLGDAVVNLVVSSALFGRHPDDDEGVLSARRAAVVSTAGLARLARRLELGDYLLLGEGEAQRGGRARPAILASAFEAVTAAIFIDRGWEAVRDWLVAHAAPELAADLPVGTLKSPKSRLQELTQREGGARPEYRLLETTGPDHSRRFRVAVVIGGEAVAEGEGTSRRSAETTAAEAALEILAAGGRGMRPALP
jgi:ribonuclease III